MNYYIIGCGGIGCRLAPELSRIITEDDRLILMDGDDIEERNLDRQFFPRDKIGENKAEQLASQCSPATRSRPYYLGEQDCGDFALNSWVFVCADNHAARAKALALCDTSLSTCIIAANEYISAEAYIYKHYWRDHETRDPRKYYPELLTDHSGDPLTPPCTGAEAEIHPQLGLSNLKAATFALHLYWAWSRIATELVGAPQAEAALPLHIRSTGTRIKVEQLEGPIHVG